MPEEHEDVDPELAGKPVGYCSPPYEHRWPKGYCPNPKGRPRKKKLMKTPAPLNEFQRRVLEEANREITQVDGKPFTYLDKLMLQLRTSDRPEDRKYLLSLIRDALEADHEWRQETVKHLIEYKAHWGPIFRERRALGQKTPDVYPHPDDIRILSPTEVGFLGPATEEEAADWAHFERFRNMCALFANEIIEAAGLFCSLEEDRQRYLKVRRLYYRVNRHFPVNFKKKRPFRFPSFRPPAEPPAWYYEGLAKQ